MGDGDDVGEGRQVTMLASKPPQTTAVNNKERGRGCAWPKNDNPIGVPVDVLVTAGRADRGPDKGGLGRHRGGGV